MNRLSIVKKITKSLFIVVLTLIIFVIATCCLWPQEVYKEGMDGFHVANSSYDLAMCLLPSDNFHKTLKAVGDVGTVSGMAGIFIDPRENTYFIGVEAKATALSGRIGGQLDVFGLQSEVGLAGELGSIGGRFGIGVRSNAEGKTEFYFGSGFALGVGWDFYIRVRFDELFS